jgi:hypothetical protein
MTASAGALRGAWVPGDLLGSRGSRDTRPPSRKRSPYEREDIERWSLWLELEIAAPAVVRALVDANIH